MNNKCCRITLINVRLPFMEAVEHLFDDNDDSHIAFVRLDEQRQTIESLFQVVKEHVTKWKRSVDAFHDEDYESCPISVSDLRHEGYNLLCCLGGNIWNDLKFEEFYNESLGKSYKNLQLDFDLFKQKLLFSVVNEMCFKQTNSVSIDLLTLFE